MGRQGLEDHRGAAAGHADEEERRFVAGAHPLRLGGRLDTARILRQLAAVGR